MADKAEKESQTTAWWQPALILFVKVSAWIVAPVIIALYLGKWLDRKYDSAPWLLLGCIAVAFTVSLIGLIKESAAEYKKIERLARPEKPEQKK